MKIVINLNESKLKELVDATIEKRINCVFSNCEKHFNKRIIEMFPQTDKELLKQLIQEEVKAQLNGRKR